MESPEIKLRIAETPEDFFDSKTIILEYVASLGIDLAFQSFDKEIDNLGEMYSEPNGGLVLASINKNLAGIAGIRKFEKDSCELKRMFIRPEFRGKGIGHLLLQTSIELAKSLGYNKVLLDTYDSMKAAIKLYTDYGFLEIPAYRHNPIDSARYFELYLEEKKIR